MPRGIPDGEKYLWTTQRVEQLRGLAADGLTSNEISRIMGCSRGAVIGKQQREGIVLRGRSLFGVSPGSPWRDPAQVLPVAERSGVSNAMVALHPTHCRWPVGFVESPDFHYCSRRRVSFERPYCEEHQTAARSTAMSNPHRIRTGLRSAKESVA